MLPYPYPASISQRRPEAKKLPLFLWYNFNDFMEKARCTKYCDVLISFQEVVNLQSFQSGVSDVKLANVQNISSLVIFFILSMFFLTLWKKNLLHNFIVFLTVSHELKRLRSF